MKKTGKQIEIKCAPASDKLQFLVKAIHQHQTHTRARGEEMLLQKDTAAAIHHNQQVVGRPTSAWTSHLHLQQSSLINEP